MNISRRQKDFLAAPFNLLQDFRARAVGETLNNSVNKFMVKEIEYKKDSTITFPTFTTNAILKTLQDFTSEGQKILSFMPIVIHAKEYRVKTFDSTLYYFFTGNYSPFFTKLITSSNDIMYIAPGVILDKDFIPILLLEWEGIISSISRIPRRGDPVEIPIVILKEAIVRVSPKAFLNKDTISKGIINKLIPFYADSTYNNIIGRRNDSISPSKYDYEYSNKFKVIVQNMDNVISTNKYNNKYPIPSEEYLYKLLEDNKETFLYTIKECAL